MLVFVPVSHHEAAKLRSGHDPEPSRGCAVTPSLLDALGAETSADEADFAALSNAGVLALLTGTDPQRLVLAADVDQSQVSDRQTRHGEVEVTGLRWSQVQSVFADEPVALENVAAARHTIGVGGGLAEALATPAVAALLNTHDLLWYATDELDQLA